jgi:hypothetical protein
MSMINAMAICFALLGLAAGGWAQETVPDFGPDGLAGLTADQRAELALGNVVLPGGSVKTRGGTSLIEAALVFNRPPKEAWALLSDAVLQVRYVPEVRSAKVVWEKKEENCLELTVRVMGMTVVYRMVQDFDPAGLYFHWTLDPTFPSEIKELAGFWRFFPYDEGRTLARYGSVVKPRFPLPGFIRDAIAKGHVRSDLESVKKFVDSGGTWQNPESKR